MRGDIMEDILFLTSVFKERIWGGHYFRDILGKTASGEKIGEMWCVSAHPEGESRISGGLYHNQKLSEVYQNEPQLFGNPISKEFPILVKVIATSDDLSVQVHPDDEYARSHENQFGKTEGWLILSAGQGARIMLGHHAEKKEELVASLGTAKLMQYLNTITVQPGEFYPIPAGTIHALGKDLVILEIQQSSDVTYRLYDYDRLDKNNLPRQLHLDKGAAVIKEGGVPHSVSNFLNEKEAVLWDNQYFRVQTFSVAGSRNISLASYGIFNVISGEITVADRKLVCGDSFIKTTGSNDITLSGQGRVALTESKI
jgi:mannose-6-phosphate isomerase